MDELLKQLNEQLIKMYGEAVTIVISTLIALVVLSVFLTWLEWKLGSKLH